MMVFLSIIIIGLIGKIYSDRSVTEVVEMEDVPALTENINSIINSYKAIDDTIEKLPVISATLSGNINSTTTNSTSPQVVIYHTHDCEAYIKTSTSVYKEISEGRTNNDNYSIVRIGNELLAQLNNLYGIDGLQDTTSHEYPTLSTAYSRSLITASAYTNQYDDILLLDIHRDAYNINSWDPEYVIIDGEKVARILIVVGKGEGYKQRGDYKINLAYAEALTKALNEIHPQLAKNVKIKDGRYNQHLCDKALLIEVGHHKNTLEEALATTKYLAQAINKTFFKQP